MLSPHLSEALKQQIVIDNRGGAAGNIGAELAAKAPPDGYTLLFAYSGTHAINPSIYRRMPFKESDFAPIIQLASVRRAGLHPSLPARTGRSSSLWRRAPGSHPTLERSGALHHLTVALFSQMTGAKLLPPTRAAPLRYRAHAGEIMMPGAATIVGHWHSGRCALSRYQRERPVLRPCDHREAACAATRRPRERHAGARGPRRVIKRPNC